MTSAPTRTSASTWPLPGFIPEFPSCGSFCLSLLAPAPALTPPGLRPEVAGPSLPQGLSPQTLTEGTPVLSPSRPSPDPPRNSLHPSNPVHGYHNSPRKPQKHTRQPSQVMVSNTTGAFNATWKPLNLPSQLRCTLLHHSLLDTCIPLPAPPLLSASALASYSPEKSEPTGLERAQFCTGQAPPIQGHLVHLAPDPTSLQRSLSPPKCSHLPIRG